MSNGHQWIPSGTPLCKRIENNDELDGYPGLHTLGIAFDLKVRKKRSGGIYSNEVLIQWFGTREEAFFFEQAMLKATRKDWDYLDKLMQQRWEGVTEIRSTRASDLLELYEYFLQELEEEGLWEFAANHCDMTSAQRDLCKSRSKQKSLS